MSRAPEVHPSSVVSAAAFLGSGTRVWHFCHVMAGARLGQDCMLAQGCFVGRNVLIGDRVRLQNHVSVFEGVTLEDDVFVGPSAVFTNVRNPRAFVKRGPPADVDAELGTLVEQRRTTFERTWVRRGATIGANATVLPGIELGEYCLIGAGAVVRDSVQSFGLMAGVPARRIGWVGRHGEQLHFNEGSARCPVTGERYRMGADGTPFLVEPDA